MRPEVLCKSVGIPPSGRDKLQKIAKQKSLRSRQANKNHLLSCWHQLFCQLGHTTHAQRRHSSTGSGGAEAWFIEAAVDPHGLQANSIGRANIVIEAFGCVQDLVL